MSELSDMLEAYGRGEVEAPEVIALLPPPVKVKPSDFPPPRELTEDTEDTTDNTWDEVANAATRGAISDEQYRELFDLYGKSTQPA